MRNRLRLCVLGLLCLHSSVFAQVEVHPGILMFCDDPSVQEAAVSAVGKFNEKMSTGNKLALFQVLTASKSNIDSDSAYSLQFSSRRSDCPVGSSKPWTDCDYLPVDREPISCNATVYMMEAGADTRQVDCQLDDVIVPEKAPCLGCLQEIDGNTEELDVPIATSISTYNAMSDSPYLFSLHTVGHATRQMVAGLRYNVKFDMKKTVCAKAEHKELSDLCVADEPNMEFVHCNSTVDVAPWRLLPPLAYVECEPGMLPMMVTRFRHPPGWSPLRNFVFMPPTTPSPSTASAKDESSEEEEGAATVTPSPDSPFHCPSNPWKAFDPHRAAVPTQEAPPGAASTQPPAEGTFSDTDLLA